MVGIGVGVFRLRRAARKIIHVSLCGCCFSPIQVNNKISRSSLESAKPNKDDPESSSSTTTTTTTVTKSCVCPICLEPLSYHTGASHSPTQAIFTAQCSHSFHFTCISSNVRHGSVTCPICRAYWTQLPRDLNPLPPSCSQNRDPILRILDDSIATYRVHRRSSLRSARYDDDDPIQPQDHHTLNNPNRLQFTLIPVQHQHPYSHPHNPSFPPSYHPCGGHNTTLHQFTSSSPLDKPESQNGHKFKPYLSTNGAASAYLSVKLAQQEATDLVLVASPNGPHLRLLKQSMALVVFSLRSVDRLAIVTYSSTATRAFPLKRMTFHGKRTALQVIDRLFYMGDAEPTPGLNKGIKILEDRAHQNPRSTILHLSDIPTPRSNYEIQVAAPPIHWFHVGVDYYGTPATGFVMHEFEEFLARLFGGIIRDTRFRFGKDGEVVKLGELRGGEERKIPLFYLNESEVTSVTYSYIEGEGEGDECFRTGEIEVSLDDRNQSDCLERDRMSIVGRTSSVENWDYHDPYMARRWAKHLHGYRI